MIYDGYVLVSQLYKKCGLSKTYFIQENGFKTESIGGYKIINKKNLPEKYKMIANQHCYDLGEYLPTMYFSNLICMSQSYLHVFLKNVETKKLSRVRLIKLSESFIKNIKNKKVPYWISDKESEDDFDDVIDFYGIKIGFY